MYCSVLMRPARRIRLTLLLATCSRRALCAILVPVMRILMGLHLVLTRLNVVLIEVAEAILRSIVASFLGVLFECELMTMWLFVVVNI